MIQAVHLRLQFEQQLGVAHVFAQSGRHQGRILEQPGKDAAIGCDDRILRIEHVKRCRAVVGVDHHLDAVPHVVNGIVVELVMARVRIAVGKRERIHDPRQPAVVAEHDVRIRIVSEERR